MKSYLLLAICFLFIVTGSASAQTKPATKVTVTGKTVAKSRGSNPNIKHDEPTVDKPVPEPAKSRGAAACSVHFDNRTGLYIKIYVDGDFKGTLEPWGDGYVTVGSGYTTIYCISTGGSREWSASGDCRTSYDYTLR